MKMTEERRKELREFNEQVKIARKKRQEEQLAKWRSEMDKKDAERKANPKKSTPKKVTPKTYYYKYDTDPLGYQTGDMPRENWFRDRDDE
jgi:DNA-nicking Smr family endonuclease